MSYRINGILFFIWIFLVIACFLVYEKTGHPGDVKALEHEIKKVLTKSDSEDILDKLPYLFDKDPSLMALVLTNDNGYIKGSMFEPGRFSSKDYKEFLDKFSTIKKVSVWKKNQLIKFDLKSKNNYVYLLISDKSRFVDNFFAVSRKVPLLKYLVFAVILLGIVLFFSFLYSLLYAERKEKLYIPEKFIKNKKTVISGNQIIKEESDFLSSLKFISEKQLINFIDLLSQKYYCATTAYFSREKNNWIPVLQKRGEIYIKGSSIRIPAFLQDFGEPENWNTPVIRENGTEYYLPVAHKDILTGVFWCKFLEMNAPKFDIIHDMHDMVSSFAKSIFIQKVYKKAVIDDETGFFNYPYFYFLLKERIQFEKNLACMIFQIQFSKDETTENMKNWGRRVFSILGNKKESKTAVCRLENGKFIALFEVPDLNEPEINTEYELYKTISRRVKDAADEIFSYQIAVYGAVVPRDKVKGNADSFLANADFALKTAVENRLMGYIMSEIGGGIA